MKHIRLFKSEQRALEFIACLYLFTITTIIGFAMLFSTDTRPIQFLSEIFHIEFTLTFFSALLLVGSLLVIWVYLKKSLSNLFRRQYYILASMGICVYALCIAPYTARMPTRAWAVIIFWLFSFSFYLIARSTWRNER